MSGKSSRADPDAIFDSELKFDAGLIKPMITYGTNPGMGMAIDGSIPLSDENGNNKASSSFLKSLDYMGFKPGMKLSGASDRLCFYRELHKWKD